MDFERFHGAGPRRSPVGEIEFEVFEPAQDEARGVPQSGLVDHREGLDALGEDLERDPRLEACQSCGLGRPLGVIARETLPQTSY